MNRLREKTTATILIAIFMISAFAVAAYAVEGTHLVATAGEPGESEARIVIVLPEGFTLGMLESISWDTYLVSGYIPHVDIFTAVETLVAEGAHVNENSITGWPSTSWFSTFVGASGTYTSGRGISGTCSDLTTVNSETAVWYSSGSAATLHTLGEFQTDATVGGMNEDTVITKLEIEIDNWVVASEAYVTNILVNELSESELNLEASVIPAIVSISVSPTTVTFDPIIFGGDSAVKVVTVTNAGNVVATITADISSEFYQAYLQIGGYPYGDGSWDLGTIAVDDSQGYNLKLVDVHTMGTHSGVLVFEATPQEP